MFAKAVLTEDATIGSGGKAIIKCKLEPNELELHQKLSDISNLKRGTQVIVTILQTTVREETN